MTAVKTDRRSCGDVPFTGNAPSQANGLDRLLSETLVSLADAASWLGGVHVSAILRWMKKGAKRPDGSVVKLESVRQGRKVMTSAEAIGRFVQAQNQKMASPESEV